MGENDDRNCREVELTCETCKSNCYFKESKDLLFGFKCHRCKRAICRSCSGLSSSEVRCVLLQKPVLLAWCKCCLSAHSKVNIAANDRTVPSMDLPDKLKEITQNLLDAFEDKLNSKLYSAVRNIYDTNKELVNGILSKIDVANTKLSNPVSTCDKNTVSSVSEAKNASTSPFPLAHSNMNNSVNNSKSRIGNKERTRVSEKDLKQGETRSSKAQNIKKQRLAAPVEVLIDQPLSSMDTSSFSSLSPSSGFNSMDQLREGVSMNMNVECRKTPEDDVGKWETQKKRGWMNKTLRPAPIQGKKDGTTSLKVAPTKAEKSYTWLFLSGLSSDSQVKEVEEYLLENRISSSICEKLKTKQTSISSFKIGIPEQYEKDVMSSDFWPVGISINKFLNLKRLGTLAEGRKRSK